MKETQLNRLCASIESWKPPVIEGPIPQGDMPGDKVAIDEGHISKSNLIFPLLVPMAAQAAKETGRVVVCVCGGSGVGKSETASLLSYYFRSAGVGAYVLSGDNYPRRVPMYNDAERTRVFRVGGVRGMLEQNVYSIEAGEKLRRLWAEETDPDPKQGQVISALGTVYIVLDGNEADVPLHKILVQVHTRFIVVPSEAAQVFADDRVDLPSFNILEHPLELRAFEVGACLAVIYIVIDDTVAPLTAVIREHRFLCLNTCTFIICFVLYG